MSSRNPVISLIGRCVHGFALGLERHKILSVACYSALFLWLCALLSATKLWWYDEFATYYPARSPSMGGVIDFFWKGNDVHTPVASLVAWFAMRLFGDGPIVDRMPFTIGYLIFCISIFVFVARRAPAVYAAAAMIFPAITLMFYYATELRAYGLVLGASGLALICWQSAAEGKRRLLSVTGLWFSLLAAICCHYYAVFLLIPLGLAEITRTWIRKRIDFPVWSALISSPFVLLIFLPAMHAALSIYPREMQPAHLGQIQSSYLLLLSIANAPILGAIIVCLLFAPDLSVPQLARFDRIPLPDWVLAGTLALLPLFAVPAALLIGAFNERYILHMVAGVAIILGFALSRYTKGDNFVGGVLTLFFLGWFVSKTLPTIKSQMHENGGLRTALGGPLRASWASELEESSLPIAVAGPGLFMQAQHYASEAVRQRIHYLTDLRKARQYNVSPTNEVNMIQYRSTGLVSQGGVVDFEEFVTRNPHFLVCVEAAYPNWQIPALLDLGAQLRLSSRKPFGAASVFEVTMP